MFCNFLDNRFHYIHKGPFVSDMDFEAATRAKVYALSKCTNPMAYIFLSTCSDKRQAQAYFTGSQCGKKQRKGKNEFCFFAMTLKNLRWKICWTADWIAPSWQKVDDIFNASYKRCSRNTCRVWFSVGIDYLKMTGAVLELRLGVPCSKNQLEQQETNDVDHQDLRIRKKFLQPLWDLNWSSKLELFTRPHFQRKSREYTGQYQNHVLRVEDACEIFVDRRKSNETRLQSCPRGLGCRKVMFLGFLMATRIKRYGRQYLKFRG